MADSITLALVGSETLMGREIRDLAADAPFELRLLASAEEEAGTLTEQAGEAAFLNALTSDALAGSTAVFLAGSRQSARNALLASPGTQFIDLTYAAEEAHDARLRAPMVEPPGYAPPDTTVHVVAHPAAIAIALLLARLHAAHPVRRAVIHVFEPASERGRAGVDELHQQTVSVFSFKNMPKAVFDEQLSFNLLARYGEEAPVALAEPETRVERHLATLLSLAGGTVPMPSLRLIQAPVFHGHSFSAWIEFENNPGAAGVEQALAAEPFDVRGAGTDAPTAVGMAGQSGLAVGAVALDHNSPAACWLWMAADNLRLSAENALAVARQLL